MNMKRFSDDTTSRVFKTIIDVYVPIVLFLTNKTIQIFELTIGIWNFQYIILCVHIMI